MIYAPHFPLGISKFASKNFTPSVLTFFMYLVLSTNAYGAHLEREYKDLSKQRLLIRITAQYIHTISQGQIDMDSAISIPCKIYGLSRLLPYNEGYDDGRPHPGTRMLDAGNPAGAATVLTNLQGEARLRLLVDLGTYFIFKPGAKKSDLDRASTYEDEAIMLAQSRAIQWKIESTSLKCNLLNQYGLAGESQKWFNNLETLCLQSGNQLAYARALLSAGEMLHYGHPDRIVKFQKALAIYKSMNTKEKEIDALSLINIENFVAKRYTVAEAYLHKIIKLQAEIDFYHQQYPFDALSWLAFRKGALSNALIYSNKSLACLLSKADFAFAAFFYTRRGLIYERLFNFEEAMVWYNKGLANKSQDTRLFWYRSVIGKVGMLNNTGKAREALALLQQTFKDYPPVSLFEKMHFAFLLGISFENVRDFKQAESEYRTFLTMADKFPIEHIYDEFPAAFFRISTFYRTMGETAKARKLLEKGNGFASTFDVYAKENYYYNLYKIDSIEGNYLEAIRNKELSFKALDTTFSYAQRKRAEQLLMRYELEKKDKSIAILNTQTRLERLESERAHRAKNIAIAALLTSLAIIVLLLNRHRARQRTRHALEESQQELDRQNTVLEVLDAAQDELLRQKEWLTTELHHRAKNDLYTATSLLISQLAGLHDAAARRAVKDSLIRMNAILLIYRNLSGGKNTSAVPIAAYINDLVNYLQESFKEGQRITFRLEIVPTSLDISQAIPLGLILAEGIVNAAKHAFGDGQQGMISIELTREGSEHLLLKISDNGVGLPPGMDITNRNSLGLDLMEGLSGQLNGAFQIENSHGVQVTVRFEAQCS